MKLYNRHGSERFCCSATGERAAVGGTDAVKQNQTVARQGRRGGEVSHQRCQDAAEASAMTPKPQQKLQQLRKRSSRSSPSSSSSFTSSSSASATAFIKPIRNLRLVPLSVVLLLIISILCGSASATTLSGVRRDRQRSAEIDRLARRGGLLVDRSEPPKVGMGLFRRENVHHPSSSSSTTSSSPTSSASSSATSSPSPSSASNSTHHPSSTQSAASSTTTADTSQSTSIPTPFDTNLASNFTTTSCPAFFNKFLSNAQFQSCHPLSLLLQNSNSFFDASKSFVRITQTLDATCNVDFKQCLSLMQQYSTDIIDTSNCGTDYKIGNAMVTQAYNGFLAYQPLYEAGCLRDSQGNYCFADAITNKTSATDSYPYYLALGSDLPASSRPTCNSCLQNTMAVFNSFAGNSNQPVSKTYVNAAQQIDISCGPTFANTTVIPSRGANLQAAPYNLFLGLLATAIVFFF